MATSDSGYIESPYQDNQNNFNSRPTVLNPADMPNDYNGGAPGDSYYTGGGSTSGGGGYNPGVTQSGVGGFLQNVGQFVTGSNNGFANAMFVPSMAMAAQQWKNADTYDQLGREAADRADPFGKYRGYYGDRLRALYDDPSQIENTPGYKFAMNQTMNNTAAKLASQGFLGSSQMQNALAAQSSGLAQQTWNTERNALMQMAGSQFDPANAGRMMMEGGQLAVNARNGALAAMFYPFGPGAAGGGGGSGGGGNGTTGAGGVPAIRSSNLPQQAVNALTSGGAAGMQAAGQLLSQGIRFIQMPDGTTWDVQQYAQHGGDIGDGNTTPFYPTQSAADYVNDPNSQFYQGPSIPDYTNDMGTPIEDGININDYVPIDDNNPYAGMDFSTGWGD